MNQDPTSSRSSKVIVITGYNRPELFRGLLQSLALNTLAGWRIAIHLEPTELVPQFEDAAAELLNGHDYHVTTNSHRLGIRANPYMALDRAFSEGAEGVLYLEEDLIVAPDATHLGAWYFSHHRPDWLALCLLAGGGGAAGFLSNPDYPELVFPARTFNSLGFAVRAEEWHRFFRNVWMKRPPAPMRTNSDTLPVGWDWQIYSILINSERLRVLQPALARSNHTGRDDGQFCTPAFHDRAFAHVPIGKNSVSEFELREIDALPPGLRNHATLWDEMVSLAKQPRVERLYPLWRYYRQLIARHLGLQKDDRYLR